MEPFTENEVPSVGVGSFCLALRNFAMARYRLGHWACPLHVDGKILFFSKEGDVTVIAATRDFRVLANHKFDGGFTASPAIAGDGLLLRSENHPYYVSDNFRLPNH